MDQALHLPQIPRFRQSLRVSLRKTPPSQKSQSRRDGNQPDESKDADLAPENWIAEIISSAFGAIDHAHEAEDENKTRCNPINEIDPRDALDGCDIEPRPHQDKLDDEERDKSKDCQMMQAREHEIDEQGHHPSSRMSFT